MGVEIEPLDTGDGAEKFMMSGAAKEFWDKFTSDDVMVTSTVATKPNQVHTAIRFVFSQKV